MLDNARSIRRNESRRRKLTLYARIHQEWQDLEDTEIEVRVLGPQSDKRPAPRRLHPLPVAAGMTNSIRIAIAAATLGANVPVLEVDAREQPHRKRNALSCERSAARQPR